MNAGSESGAKQIYKARAGSNDLNIIISHPQQKKFRSILAVLNPDPDHCLLHWRADLADLDWDFH